MATVRTTLAVTGALMALAATPAAAVTFASSPALLDATFTAGAGSSTLTVTGTTFLFGTDFLLPPYSPFFVFAPSVLSLTATSTTPMTFTTNYTQQGYSGSFSIMSGSLNVLSGTFSHAILDVTVGSYSTASLLSAGNPVSFTSDVFDMAKIGLGEMALAFTSIKPTLGLGSGYGTSFDATASAQFASEVPEPATWAMLIFGFGLVGFAARRRRNDGLVRISA